MEFTKLIASSGPLGSFISFFRSKKNLLPSFGKTALPSARSQMAASKLLTRSAFQILFKRKGLCFEANARTVSIHHSRYFAV